MTAEQASLSTTTVGARPAGGVYLIPSLGAPRCAPPQPHPSIGRDVRWDALVECLQKEPLSKLDLSGAQDQECVVLTLNAGSLNGKLPRLLALLALVEPDVVCGQETWEAFEPSDQASLPFLVFTGPQFDGGGLLTLIHRRHAGPRPPSVLKERHCHRRVGAGDAEGDLVGTERAFAAAADGRSARRGGGSGGALR